MKRQSLLLILLGVFAAALLLRWPSLDLPLDRDEGEFASLAWLWSDGHGVPYRDWVQQKPPANIGVHALAQRVFSDGVRGLRLVSMLWTALTTLGLALFVLGLARRDRLGAVWDRRRDATAALAAGLVAALLFSSARTQSLTANTETWLSLPLLAAFSAVFLRREAPSSWTWLGAGLWIGLASLFKQPVLTALLFLPLAARPGAGRLLPAVAFSALGAALAWALAWALFAAQGAGGDLLFNCLAYNEGYVLSGWSNLNALIRGGLGLSLALAPELLVVTLLAAMGWLALGPSAGRRALGAWLATAAVLLLASGRFYPHYAIGLLAPLALLAGLGLAAMRVAGRGRWVRALLIGLFLLPWAFANARLWTAADGAERSLRIFGTPLFAQAPLAAQRLQELCPPDKKLFQWGDEAQLYYLAKRAPATRFLYSYPFSGEAPPWPGEERAFVAALRDSGTGAAVLSKGLDPADPLQSAIGEALQELYEPEGSVQPYVLGGRRP